MTYRSIVSALLLIIATSCSHKTAPNPQDLDHKHSEFTLWQLEQNELFKDPVKSPIEAEELADFKGLEFYPYDDTYKVEAQLTRTPGTPIFDMMTTSGKAKKYRQYAIVEFKIGDKDLKLNVYQSQDLKDSEEFRNHLFLPFYDATSGMGSYAGGRYISLGIPDGDSIIINFNEAYNPYCAYSDGYSCPITPAVNNLQEVQILAGTKDYIK